MARHSLRHRYEKTSNAFVKFNNFPEIQNPRKKIIYHGKGNDFSSQVWKFFLLNFICHTSDIHVYTVRCRKKAPDPPYPPKKIGKTCEEALRNHGTYLSVGLLKKRYDGLRFQVKVMSGNTKKIQIQACNILKNWLETYSILKQESITVTEKKLLSWNEKYRH